MTSPLWERLRLSCAPDHQPVRIRCRIRDLRRLFRLHPHAPWIAFDCVGDVEGHGFGSALVLAFTRAYVRCFAALGLEVDQILTQVKRMLVQDLGDGFFVTLALASLDICNRSLVYAVAGYIPGYILGESGEVDILGTCASQVHAGQTIVLSRQMELPNRIVLAGTSREPDAR